MKHELRNMSHEVKEKELQENKVQEQEEKKEQEEQETPVYRVHPKSGWDKEDRTFRCVVCGDNMGPDNSRQLCGKSHCLYN